MGFATLTSVLSLLKEGEEARYCKYSRNNGG